MTRAARARCVAAIAAVAWPFAISALVLAALDGGPPAPDPEQVRRTRATAPPAIDAALRGRDLRAVAVGNSITRADVVDELVSARLGLEAAVATVTSPGATPPTWYLLLKNRVYRQGHAPRWVLLVNPLANLLEVEPASELELRRMREHMERGDEAVLLERMGLDDPWSARLWRLRVRRAELQAAVVDAVRDGAVGAVFGAGERPLLDEGHALAEDAFAEVFPAGARVADRDGGDPALDLARARSPVPVEASFLPTMLALAASHGSQVVVVSPPILGTDGALPPAEQEALVAWLEARGARFVDLSAGFGPELFDDPWHLSHAGALVFSRRLARALAALEAERTAAR